MALVTVSFSKSDILNRIKGKEKLLADTGVKRLLGTETKRLIRECFDKGQDPYGVPWEPLRYRVGQILVLTGVLRGSFRAVNDGDDLLVGTSVFYAPFHQEGAVWKQKARTQPASKRTGRFTKSKSKSSRSVRVPGGVRRIPRRPFLPDGRGMPPKWRKRLRDAVRQFTAQI